eukprot:85497_1
MDFYLTLNSTTKTLQKPQQREPKAARVSKSRLENVSENASALIDDDSLCATLIGSLVNTGNVREIYEYHRNEEIPQNYDCNHIRVFGTGWKKFSPAPIGKDDQIKLGELCVCGSMLTLTDANQCYHHTPLNKEVYQTSVQCNNCDIQLYSNEKVWHCSRKWLNLTEHETGYDLCSACFDLRTDALCGKNTKFTSINDRIYDEYAVRESSRIIPRYLIKLQRVKTVFVWRNTTFDQYDNAPIYEEIAKKNVVYVCKDTLTALKVIELKKKFCDLYIISNSQDGPQFIGKQLVDTLGIEPSHILVFTASVSWANQWANPLNVEVTGSSSRVISFVSQIASKNRTMIDEYFTKTNNGNTVISFDNKTITRPSGGWSTSYGAVNINTSKKAIYKWKFKINRCLNNTVIGIDESSAAHTAFPICYQATTVSYCVSAYCGKKYYQDKSEKYGPSFTEEGTIVDMILNLYDDTLSYCKNGVNSGKAFDVDMSKEYAMCVTLGIKGESISLMECTMEHC